MLTESTGKLGGEEEIGNWEREGQPTFPSICLRTAKTNLTFSSVRWRSAFVPKARYGAMVKMWDRAGCESGTSGYGVWREKQAEVKRGV